MKESRFIALKPEKIALCEYCQIIIDKQTGVKYLFVKDGYGAGLTPLLDDKANVEIEK